MARNITLPVLKGSKDSNAPSHLILPHILSAIQLSSELGLWPLYRLGIVVLGEVLLAMEGAGMAKKAIEEVESVWDQVSWRLRLVLQAES